MTERLLEEHQAPKWENKKEATFLDLFIALAKHKRLIAGSTLGIGLITAVVAMIITPVFRAETTILPPNTSSSMTAQMLGQLGAATGLLGAMPSGKSTGDLYVELTKSRTVLDHVVDRFDLMALYKEKTRAGARRHLAKRVTARSNIKSGLITIGVEDTDPVRASSMANAVVEELKTLNKGLSVTEAAQRRLFFEEQLKDAKEELAKAEDAMKAFQEKSGAVKIDAQADAIIQGISALRAQIAAKEVQIRVMMTYSTEQNPEVVLAKEELKGMQAQLSKIEAKSSDGGSIVPSGNIPAASTEFFRRARDLKFSETLYELLLGQYQVAKLDEARDASVIQIVEKAEPPENKVKPRRLFMVFFAVFVSLFLSILTAFFMEYKESISKDPEQSEKVAALKRYLAL